jgi:hypothetical protein
VFFGALFGAVGAAFGLIFSADCWISLGEQGTILECSLGLLLHNRVAFAVVACASFGAVPHESHSTDTNKKKSRAAHDFHVISVCKVLRIECLQCSAVRGAFNSMREVSDSTRIFQVKGKRTTGVCIFT